MAWEGAASTSVRAFGVFSFYQFCINMPSCGFAFITRKNVKKTRRVGSRFLIRWCKEDKPDPTHNRTGINIAPGIAMTLAEASPEEYRQRPVARRKKFAEERRGGITIAALSLFFASAVHAMQITLRRFSR